MSQVPCTNCGRPTTGRSEDRVSGRIVALCETCESSKSRLWFMLLALTAAVVCLMQNI
jgi:hypothetical protein